MYETAVASFTRFADGTVEVTWKAATDSTGYPLTRLTLDEASGLEEYLVESGDALAKHQAEILAGVKAAQSEDEAATKGKDAKAAKADAEAEILAVAGHDVPVETADEAKAREDAQAAEQAAVDAAQAAAEAEAKAAESGSAADEKAAKAAEAAAQKAAEDAAKAEAEAALSAAKADADAKAEADKAAKADAKKADAKS